MYAKDSVGHAVGMTTASRSEAGPLVQANRSAPPAAEMVPIVPRAEDRGLYLRWGKRAFDVVVSLAALVLLSPLFPILALLIRLDSRGPTLYRSTRIGYGGRPFTFWKLRSMVCGADGSKHALAHLNEVSGPVFKLSSDPRVTRIGRFLRRSSLDEIPQIVHVLRGQMTLVGPRPPEPEEVVQYAPGERRRLSVRPGLTCLWQISGRSLIGFEEWMRLDLAYIDNRSFMLDVKILLKTIPAILSGKGAY